MKSYYMKLNAYIAHAGVCSRRNAIELIKNGHVTVNNELVLVPSYDVLNSDQVAVDGKPIQAEQMIYILLNKPRGYITTVSDEHGRRTVVDLLKGIPPVRIYPVGRLDYESSGLLLLTNDGDLAFRLSHPSFQIQKIYQVTVDKDLPEVVLRKILKGVSLEDGRLQVDDIRYCSKKSGRCVQIALHSGRNRIIRRLFAALGYEVKSLERVAYAGISARELKRGLWRYLKPHEITHLNKLVVRKRSSK